MGFSAFWFSHQCHLNREVLKIFLKIHKTINVIFKTVLDHMTADLLP